MSANSAKATRLLERTLAFLSAPPPPAHPRSVDAADATAKLNRDLKGKTVDGYTVRGWRYKRKSGDFVIYVIDGRKWRDEYAKSGGMPKHGVVFALLAEQIIEEEDPLVPSPKEYIFRDARTELYRLDAEMIMQKLKEGGMGPP
jgi:hypothetical protein